MPAIVIAVVIVQADGSSSTIPGRLCPAPMLRRIYGERSQQHQQHGGY
jgi:hypothetical protein